jgi:hypothetical protein
VSCKTCHDTGFEPRPVCNLCTEAQQDVCPDPVCQLNDQPMPCRNHTSPKSRLRVGAELLAVRAAIWLQLHVPVLLPILDRVLHVFGICIGH